MDDLQARGVFYVLTKEWKLEQMPIMSTLQQALENSPVEQTRKALQKNRRINLRVSQAEHMAIARAAADEGMTISEYILALHYSHVSDKVKIEAAVLKS